MPLPRNVASLQKDHVRFELESIDRLYLNAYVPKLTSARASPPSSAATWVTASLPPSRPFA